MALEHESDSGLAVAVRAARSQTAFGKLIGKRQSVIHDWLRQDRPLPAEYVRLVEQELGVPRHVSRPDLYPPEEYAHSPDPQAGEASPAGSSKAAGDAVPHRQACA